MAGADPLYNNVSLLLHFDGANNGTTFTDNAPSPVTMAGGSTTTGFTSTTGPQFGTACGQFVGSTVGATGLNTPTAAAGGKWDMAAVDWTHEIAVNPTSVTTTQSAIYQLGVGTTTASGVQVSIKVGIVNVLIYSSAAALLLTITAPSANKLVAGAYTRIAVVRKGALIGLFQDGKQIAVGTLTAANVVLGTATVGYVARLATAAQATAWIGKLDELRITKGVARYNVDAANTSTYTPEAQAFGDALPTNYPAAQVDAATATDLPDSDLDSAQSTSEAAIASDAGVSAFDQVASESESANAVDQPAGAAASASTTSESGAAADTTSTSTAATAACSEPATAVDAPNAMLSFIAAQADSGTASDALSATAVALASTSESATASDAATSTALASTSTMESLAATDTSTATPLLSLSANDNLDAMDSRSSSMSVAKQASEPAAASEAVAGSLPLFADRSEQGAADDTESSSVVLTAFMWDDSNAIEQSKAWIGDAAISEPATASDTSAAMSGPGTVVEALVGLDSASGLRSVFADDLEAGQAIESNASSATFTPSQLEDLGADSYSTTSTSRMVDAAESAASTDVQATSGDQPATLNEVSVAADAANSSSTVSKSQTEMTTAWEATWVGNNPWAWQEDAGTAWEWVAADPFNVSPTLAEPLAASTTQSTSSTMTQAINEPASALDTLNASAENAVTISEPATAQDYSTPVVNKTPTIVEPVGIAGDDSNANNPAPFNDIREVDVLLDSTDGVVADNHPVSAADTLTAVESSDALFTLFYQEVSDAQTLVDSYSGAVMAYAEMSEPCLAFDVLDGLVIPMPPTVVEQAAASDRPEVIILNAVARVVDFDPTSIGDQYGARSGFTVDWSATAPLSDVADAIVTVHYAADMAADDALALDQVDGLTFINADQRERALLADRSFKTLDAPREQIEVADLTDRYQISAVRFASDVSDTLSPTDAAEALTNANVFIREVNTMATSRSVTANAPVADMVEAVFVTDNSYPLKATFMEVIERGAASDIIVPQTAANAAVFELSGALIDASTALFDAQALALERAMLGDSSRTIEKSAREILEEAMALDVSSVLLGLNWRAALAESLMVYDEMLGKVPHPVAQEDKARAIERASITDATGFEPGNPAVWRVEYRRRLWTIPRRR